MNYPSNEMQFAPQAHPHKKHENSRSRASLPPSLQELQGKLNILLNHTGSSGEIDQLLPHFERRVSTLAKTQCGSRFLQQRISEGHPGYFSLVMKEVFSDLPSLMVDLFGNYLCQKLIEKCNEQQRDAMLRKLASHIPDISCDRQGTRAVQKIVSATTTHNQRETFMASISREPALLRLMRDPNGSHVIHAVLDKFPLSMLTPIFKLAYKTCYKLAVHQHGLCVLKKCMTLAKPKDFMDLSKKILVKVLTLVNDQYGNYLIQHIIDRSIINRQNAIDQGDTKLSPEESGDAINLLHSRLIGNYCRLSKQKFSSNVVEKCLRVGSPEWQSRIIEELMDKKSSPVLSLLQDSYGNYVMQNALNVAENQQASDLVRLIKPHLSALRKNIRKKWERLITAKCNTISNGEQPKPAQYINTGSGNSKRQQRQKSVRQQQQQQQQQRSWNANSGFVRAYPPEVYNATMPSSIHQMHDALVQTQPAQMIPSSQMHHSGQMPPPMHRTNMMPYPQSYVPPMQYGRQPSQIFVDHHLPTHGAPY